MTITAILNLLSCIFWIAVSANVRALRRHLENRRWRRDKLRALDQRRRS